MHAAAALCHDLLSMHGTVWSPNQQECLEQIGLGIQAFLERLHLYEMGHYSRHDLCTPLAAVIGFTQMLTEELEGKLSLAHHYVLQQVLDHARFVLAESAYLRE